MSIKEKIILENAPDILDKKISNPKTGRKIKVASALAYPTNEPVRKKAEQLIKKDKPASTKNEKSLKPEARKFGVSKECREFLKEKGFPKLSVLPQTFVKKEEIQFNPDLKKLGGPDSTWVAKFPAFAADGTKVMKTAHTPGFMKKSQKKNFAKCSKIKEEDIMKLDKNTSKLLKNKDKRVADAACVIKIISDTGLRVGSVNESETGNVGVRTLRKEHFTFEGNKVKLKFIGKEYQINVAEIDNKEVVDYLKKILKDKKSTDNAFDSSYGLVTSLLKKINPKDINPKNLRTYKATKLARELCADPTIPPPPLKTDNPKEIKKQVKEKLNEVFTRVSSLLNNTPAMARGSYVHPAVITEFLDSLKLKPKDVGYKHKLIDSIIFNSKEIKESKEIQEETKLTGMDKFFDKFKDEYTPTKEDESISDEDAENCEEYLLPDWWDNDDVELVPIK